MIGLVGRRLVQSLLLAWGAATLLFFLLHAAPGEPWHYFAPPELGPETAAAVRRNLGLDQPLLVQYARWLRRAAVLDFQVSIAEQRPVFEIVAEALPNTVLLSGCALLLAFGGGVGAALFAARRQGSRTDRAVSLLSLLVYSTPPFWLALMLVLGLSHALPLFPAVGMASVGSEDWSPLPRLLDRGAHLVLPSLALSAAAAAAVARYARESLRDALGEEFVRAARAKGLPEATVLRRHAFRNALLPVITLFGLSLPVLFSGSVLVEHVFAWPGMGRLLVRSILAQDVPVVLAASFGLTVLAVAGNLLADLLCAAADPRLRRGRG